MNSLLQRGYVKDLAIPAKLGVLSDRIAWFREICPENPDGLEDRDARDLVAFNLMLAVQSCLDIASHLIADEAWPPTPDLATSFRRLQELEDLERFASQVAAWTRDRDGARQED